MKNRGLIEAWRFLSACLACLPAFPRLKNRGLIEAPWSTPVPPSTRPTVGATLSLMSSPRAAGLRAALEMYEVAEALVVQRLIREGWPPDERARRLREWRLARPTAPQGDCAGRPVDLSRFR